MRYEEQAAVMQRANRLRAAAIGRIVSVVIGKTTRAAGELAHWIKMARCPPGIRI